MTGAPYSKLLIWVLRFCRSTVWNRAWQYNLLRQRERPSSGNSVYITELLPSISVQKFQCWPGCLSLLLFCFCFCFCILLISTTTDWDPYVPQIYTLSIVSFIFVTLCNWPDSTPSVCNLARLFWIWSNFSLTRLDFGHQIPGRYPADQFKKERDEGTYFMRSQDVTFVQSQKQQQQKPPFTLLK